jgi:hypothetical protein
MPRAASGSDQSNVRPLHSIDRPPTQRLETNMCSKPESCLVKVGVTEPNRVFVFDTLCIFALPKSAIDVDRIQKGRTGVVVAGTVKEAAAGNLKLK